MQMMLVPMRQLLVVPRLGTISPWASKATDIVHNCGIDAVLRVERGIVYNVEFAEAGAVNDELLQKLSVCLHDRMTETVLPVNAEPSMLFSDLQGKTMAVVDIVAGGKAALEKANVEMGLASV